MTKGLISAETMTRNHFTFRSKWGKIVTVRHKAGPERLTKQTSLPEAQERRPPGSARWTGNAGEASGLRLRVNSRPPRTASNAQTTPYRPARQPRDVKQPLKVTQPTRRAAPDANLGLTGCRLSEERSGP